MSCINTARCWLVQGRFTITLLGGKILIIQGEIKQTPALFEKGKIKANGNLLDLQEIEKIVDGNGHLCWSHKKE